MVRFGKPGLALALLIAACSPGVELESLTSTTTPTSTTVATTSTTTGTATTTTFLPGEPIDFGPREGDLLAVIGVAHDDTLNLRAAPGATQTILDRIAPTYEGLVAHGATRDLTNAFWIKVSYEDIGGWVHMGFIAYLGHTDDVTATIVADLGEIPTADSMRELGLIVAETMVSDEPPSKIVLVVDETVDDLGEVTYDIIGLGDDAVRGLRLHILGEPINNGFSLESVELTTLCGRGVTEDGLCI